MKKIALIIGIAAAAFGTFLVIRSRDDEFAGTEIIPQPQI